jgi:hypothetical protein
MDSTEPIFKIVAVDVMQSPQQVLFYDLREILQ